tara:strand:- start:270 stop:629 length:360 start_codon:yes stop_codon:yes gene_type:complete
MREILLALPSIILIGSANAILKFRIEYLNQKGIYILSNQFLKFLLDPYIAAGALATIASILWWLSIVSQVRIGVVYPLIQSGAMLFTFVCGLTLFKETIENSQFFGITFMILGIILIAR